MDFWVRRDGKVLGHWAERKIRECLATDQIKPTDYLSRDRLGPWVPAKAHPIVARILEENSHMSVLGLNGKVTMNDVRRAYRERMTEYHPDKVSHLGVKLRSLAEEESKRINAALEFFKRNYERPSHPAPKR